MTAPHKKLEEVSLVTFVILMFRMVGFSEMVMVPFEEDDMFVVKSFER